MNCLRAPFIIAIRLIASAAMLGPVAVASGRADLMNNSVFYEDLSEGRAWFERSRLGLQQRHQLGQIA